MSNNTNKPPLELPLFTCLMDMIALELGLFCDNRDPQRFQLAHNNLRYGLRLSDGSVFKYSCLTGPTVTVETSQSSKPAEETEKPPENEQAK